MSDREWFASVEISTQSCDFIIEAVPWHHLPYECWWSGRTLLGVRNIVNVGSVLLRTHNPRTADCACSVNTVMPDGSLFEAAWYELERRGLVPDDLISRPDLARGGPYVVWRVQ